MAAATTAAMTMVVATTAAMTAETLQWQPFRVASDVLCGLPSLHLGSLHNGRQMFPSHGGDEVAYGWFGARGRGRLQVPKPQHAQTF
jgi:hypothetical protein